MNSPKEKSTERKTSPLYLRSFFFGLMLFAWWILTVEVPGRMLFRLALQRGVDRQLTTLSIWAYGVTQRLMSQRVWWMAVIVVTMALHYWLWTRWGRYDVYGKWLFRAGFLVLYVVLYAFFFLVFLGAEIPVWTWPSQIVPAETP